MYSGFGEKVTDMRQHKISIFGLTLTYKEKDGSLVLEEDDFRSAKKTFPAIPSDLKGMRLARIEELVKGKAVRRADPNPTTPPCKPRWSNAFRLELENVDGTCLHFTAASTGPIKVLFSAKPGNEKSRYGVVIEPTVVRMFKVRIDSVKQQLKLLSNKLSNLVSTSIDVDYSENALQMNVPSLKLHENYICA